MTRHAIIVTDLGFGDAGKGSIVDYLARTGEAPLVIRFNGGPQAAHNVITHGGKHHTFAQFGSGTFVPGTTTHLSRFMLVNPFNCYAEAEHLEALGVENAWERLSVDYRARIITPWHTALNRLREIARGAGRHGSCGQGIGETMADSLAGFTVYAGDFAAARRLRSRLTALRDRKREQLQPLLLNLPDTQQVRQERRLLEDPAVLDLCVATYRDFAETVRITDEAFERQLLESHHRVIFEGAQGVLLDEWFGFHPYTTWSTTTFENALTVLSDNAYDDKITRLGVIRGYATRHGPGPFVTEDVHLTEAVPDSHNGNNTWQRAFRIGYPDLVALRYALTVTQGADALAVTNLDRMAAVPLWRIANAYQPQALPPEYKRYVEVNEKRQIVTLKPDGKDNLDHQETLTRLLFSCSPVYRRVFPDQKEQAVATRASALRYLALLEDALGVPVRLASFGPQWTDKEQISSPKFSSPARTVIA